MTTQLPPSLEKCSPIVRTYLIKNDIPRHNSCTDVPYTVLTAVTDAGMIVFLNYDAITFRNGLLHNTLSEKNAGGVVLH